MTQAFIWSASDLLLVYFVLQWSTGYTCKKGKSLQDEQRIKIDFMSCFDGFFFVNCGGV